jgi:hypothetical protein
MTGDAHTRRAGFGGRLPAPHSWWSVLRIAAVLLWVVWAALSWWSQPRHATVEQARADLAAGRLVSYEWGDSWESNVTWRWAEPPTLESSGTYGPLFAWKTADLRVHYARLDASDSAFTLRGTVDESQYSGKEAASLAEAVQAAGHGSGFPGNGTSRLLMLVSLSLALPFLVVLVTGPAPAVGTRWFWYWLVSTVPLGLGLLYWLGRERPWSSTATTPDGPPGKENRHRWYVGLGCGFVTTIVFGLVLLGLNRLVGDWLFPAP